MGTLVGFVVGMLISYQVIYTDLADQLPQYATLKGMGYGTSYLVRIVFEQQRQHRSPCVTASIVERHEHGDARALDQSP